MNEVFIVKNQTVSTIELFDFGVLILPDASAELGNFDDALLSEQLQSLLQTGDLVRLVNGAPVAYANANTIFYGFDVSANDASIKFLNDSKVDRAGDTITGNLIINASLNVLNDASIQGDLWLSKSMHIDRRIHLHPYNNPDPSYGDLWIEPSTFNLLYKHPFTNGIFDASSYDLTDRLLRTENDWLSFEDTSILVEGDRILIEQAAAGFAKKKVSASAFTRSIGVLSYASYAADLTISSTTSKANQLKLNLVTDASAPASIYRIGWTFQLTNSNNSKSSRYRVYVDASVLDEDTVSFPTGGSYLTFSGFQHIDLPDGSHNITIEYAAVTNTARIKGARLEFQAAQAQVT